MARYAETWLHPEGPGPAYVEILRVKPDEQTLLIPAPAARYVPWLQGGEKLDVILELCEPGRIVGHSRQQFDEQLGDFIGQQVSLYTGGPEGRRAARTRLLAIGERNLTAKINRDRYLSLSPRAAFHLGFERSGDHTLFFIALLETFEIWTAEFHERVRPELTRSISEFSSILLPEIRTL